MIKFKNKKIYFSGRGEKIEKDELIKYFIQNEATLVESLDDVDVIVQGYMTSTYDQDKFYLMSKNGIEVIDIEKLEKEFSNTIDIDSILIAIKISKEKQRVINLLKNKYFDDDTFVKILKFYNWGDEGIYDNDDNRDVATYITARFCSLVESNHNIQYSPIGVYYTALETTNGKLLEAIFNMPYFSISDKNAKEDQPLTLRQTVALNPNTPKPVLIQILKDNDINELKFLAQNDSLNKLIIDKLFNLNDKNIKLHLIKSNNIDTDHLDEIIEDKELKNAILKNIDLTDTIFDKFINIGLSDIEYIYLSSNLSLTQKQIDFLFTKNIDNVNINLLKNKNCDKGQINKFLKLNDKIYNITIAHNQNISEKIFYQLSKLEDFDVNITISMNSSTPKDLLKELYMNDIHEINMGLSQNTNTPINILMQLQINNHYTSNISNNETYKEFSRNNLGIIQDKNNQFKRSIYN